MSSVNILLLEDSDLDADLTAARLEREGIRFSMDRVASRDEFVAALARRHYDVVLADHSLPSFDGMTALALARERAPQTPFIIVSGMLGEEKAIEAIKAGAADYVLKQRLERLGPAVKLALVEARERAERRRTSSS